MYQLLIASVVHGLYFGTASATAYWTFG
jgi:hypothetical protein